MREIAPSGDYRGWRAGLILFGVIEILLALLMSLSTIVLALAAGAGASSTILEGVPLDLSTLGPALLLYAAAAVAIGCTGIGSILPRRWVRPIALFIAWPWLLAGCVAVGILLAGIAVPGVGVLLPAAPAMTEAGLAETVVL